MKLGIITPIGPGHESSYEVCKESIIFAWQYHCGPFSDLEIIAMPDPEGKFGRSQRRNAGIKIAKENNCEWVFFLDADDLMARECFENVSEYIDKYDAIWGNICEMPYGDFTKLKLRETQLKYTESIDDILKVDPFNTLQMGHFVKTNIADEIGFDDSIDIGEDFRYYLKLCAKFKFIKCPEIFFINQRGNHSSGPSSGNGRQWRLNVQSEIKSAISERELITKVSLDEKESFFYITNPFDIIQAHLCKGIFFEQGALIDLKKYVGTQKVIAEIGANIGNHTIFYAHHMNPVKILPFEPNPSSILILRKNLLINNCFEKIDERGIGLGLGSKNTTYKIFQNDPDNLGAAKLIEGSNQSDDIEVKVFDEVIGEIKIDFMRIDVEGMEFEVLDGASQSISNNKPVIYIEVWNQSIPKLEKWIQRFNYEVIGNIKMVNAVNFLIAPKT